MEVCQKAEDRVHTLARGCCRFGFCVNVDVIVVVLRDEDVLCNRGYEMRCCWLKLEIESKREESLSTSLSSLIKVSII